MRLWGAICSAITLLVMALPATATEAVHHDVTVNIAPSQGTILVQDQLRIDGAGETTLILNRPFALESATLDGKEVAIRRGENTLRLNLGASGTHTLSLAYQAQDHPALVQDGAIFDPGWLAHPPDRLATWSVALQIEPGQKVVVPGRLMSEQDGTDAYRATFRMETPHAPPVLITGPYTITEKTLGKVRLRTYFHKELAPLAEGYLEDAERYVGYYSQTIGTYPYDGFFIISGSAEVGWGLPGMTYMGRRVLQLPFIRYTSLPHEVLHNWWGNAVEADYAAGNWAEGLTTYQADHAMAVAAKPEGGRDTRLEWLRNYAALPDVRDVPLTQFQSKTHDATQVVGYGKAAFVFHMLKVRFGADTFQRALQRFYQAQRFKVAGWPDIQAAFEAETGENLATFFADWLTRPGAPDLRVAEVERTLDGVRFTLRQSQGARPYPLVVPVRVETRDGTETFSIALNGREDRFTLTTASPATTLHIDPDFDVFRHLSAAETPPILRDVSLDTNAALVPFGDQGMRDSAHALAQNLLQTRLHMLDGADSRTQIVTGTPEQIDVYLDSAGVTPRDAAIRTAGDARAWAATDKDGRTVLVVEAPNQDALQALARVLPHYKRRSYVVLENGKTIDKGTWPAGEGPLTVPLN